MLPTNRIGWFRSPGQSWWHLQRNLRLAWPIFLSRCWALVSQICPNSCISILESPLMAWWYGFPYKSTCVATHLPRRLCTNYLCQLTVQNLFNIFLLLSFKSPIILRSPLQICMYSWLSIVSFLEVPKIRACHDFKFCFLHYRYLVLLKLCTFRSPNTFTF